MEKNPHISIISPKGLDNDKYVKENLFRLFSLVPSLKTILTNGAPRFLKLGQTLQSINSKAQDITQITMEVVRTTGDKSDLNLLNNVAELAKSSLKELKKSGTDISIDLKNVETSMMHLDRLHKSLHVIRNISKTLNIVSLNIAIESSRSGKSKDTFSFFVEEINDLSNRVNIIARDISNDSKSSQIKQQDIWTNVIDRGKQLQEITATADDMIEGNINKLKDLFETSRNKLEKSTFYSKEISRHIGEIIESIQFEDITRQQTEHIIETIQDIKEQHNVELYLNDNLLIEPETLAQIYSLITIQAAQIKQVISEIQEAHTKILYSFTEIATLTDLMVGLMASFSSKKNIQSEMGTPFEELISDFTNLDLILDQGYTVSERIEEAMLGSSEIAFKLSSHIKKVEDISLDLHIKAINAIIMSDQLGSKGLALSVLAKTVTHVSKESNSFVTGVVEIINSISKLTENLRAASESVTGKGKSNITHKESSLASALNEISGTYKKFQEDSCIASGYATSLKETLGLAGADLSFLTEMVDQLESCLKDINLVVKSLEPHVNQSYLKEINQNSLSEKYTMKVERDIHMQLYTESSPSPLIQNTSGDDAYDNLGDNVELF